MEIREVQHQISNWKNSIMPPCENTPQREGERAIEEYEEFKTELENYDGSDEARFRLASESIDNIIRHFGVIGSCGFDVEVLLADKITTIYTKYNPETICDLQAQGLSWTEAMAQQKQLYEGQ